MFANVERDYYDQGCQNRDFASDRKRIARSQNLKLQSKSMNFNNNDYGMRHAN